MKKTGFFAHPSNPMSHFYTITRAIELINSSGNDIEVKSWAQDTGTGKFILDHVCSEILEADVFLCDLTHLNLNVLFELGYAIINDKPVWISVDESVQDRGAFGKETGEILTAFSHASYTNNEELGWQFLSDAPFDRLADTPYQRYLKHIRASDLRETSLLYLKSTILTDATNDLTKVLKRSETSLVTDDIQEAPRRTFEWYAENVYRSIGVVAHFLDDIRAEKNPQNAKYAFVCGMAHGAGKPLLMLAHAPHKPAIDFQDLMLVHQTPDECVVATNEWIASEIRERYERARRRRKSKAQRIQATLNLQRVNIGQYVAEDEDESISEYFVETAFYNEALRVEKYSLYIGRKGTGKTASLYKMTEDLTFAGNYHVCAIKPSDYDLEGVFRLFQLTIPKSQTSFLVETLWKFLIYSELSLSVYHDIYERPEPTWTANEREFIEFIDKRKYLFQVDFTTRMEQTIESLCNLDLTARSVKKQKESISEALHQRLLGDLRQMLGKALQEKDKVFVLIDNLDKTWERGRNLRALSGFLFGLLNVGQDIPTAFHRQDSRTERVNLALIVFLRSDIYAEILPEAREKDRLKTTAIDWNDPRTLWLVIERRFASALPDDSLDDDEIWDKFFCDQVEGIPPKQYIIEHVIRRPRDIIFLCKQALANAINRGHSKIESEDIIDAQIEYSKYCWRAVLAETEVQFDNIEDLLIEFAGEPEIVTRQMIEEYLAKAIIPTKRIKAAIDLLCDVTFLGLETSPDNFEFIYDESRKKIMQRMARKVAKSTGVEQYKINIPFHKHLGIKT